VWVVSASIGPDGIRVTGPGSEVRVEYSTIRTPVPIDVGDGVSVEGEGNVFVAPERPPEPRPERRRRGFLAVPKLPWHKDDD
jgi:hypothetical protein